ncbi:hypothetical protein HPB49_014080 [Dermacentor silvarum]|uniref:Uncharacterized protein n=1 Tax=Dermacentor silvarum TaxID=543639 RepID=A0ACB8E141_DERSI|nr:hypothetical protein HPB49_014080 [Dermacentor silvarum]
MSDTAISLRSAHYIESTLRHVKPAAGWGIEWMCAQTLEIKDTDKERRQSPAQPLPVAIKGRRAEKFEAAEQAQGRCGAGTGTAFEVKGTAWRTTRISN